MAGSTWVGEGASETGKLWQPMKGVELSQLLLWVTIHMSAGGPLTTRVVRTH